MSERIKFLVIHNHDRVKSLNNRITMHQEMIEDLERQIKEKNVELLALQKECTHQFPEVKGASKIAKSNIRCIICGHSK